MSLKRVRAARESMPSSLPPIHPILVPTHSTRAWRRRNAAPKQVLSHLKPRTPTRGIAANYCFK